MRIYLDFTSYLQTEMMQYLKSFIMEEKDILILHIQVKTIPDSKVHEANMGPIWVLSAPGGPHVGLMNLAIWDGCWWPGDTRS